ncbi:hypothetical protein G9A89_018738 [Geosiphon pyriformis]|nr:hypothetical protein G9A89_018738 [Geosiphon pyriformis]
MSPKQSQQITGMTKEPSKQFHTFSRILLIPDAVIHARDFESAELEANYTQAVNLVMNGLSELDSKLKQFTTNLSAANLLANSTHHLSPTVSTHLSAAVSGNLPAATSSNITAELTSKRNSKAKTDTAKLKIINGGPLTDLQFHGTTINLLVTSEDATSHNSESNQQLLLTSNIPPATVTNDKTLAAIFPFELKETTMVPLFNRATLKEKPIIAMYTNAKVNGHSIKLILDSGLAGSIITRQFMDQLGC